MKKNQLLKSKKGVLGVSLDSLGSWIQGIMSVIPAPIKFLIFLFLLITLGYILSILFNAFGIFCNSANQPVQLNANLITSVSLIGQIPDPKDLGKEALGMEESGFTIVSEQVSSCSRETQKGTIYFGRADADLVAGLFALNPLVFGGLIGGYDLKDIGSYNITKPTFFYDGRFCTDCKLVSVCDSAGSCNKVCLGDVYRKNDADKGILQKMMCGNIGCEPPQHYYYRQSQNLYICADETCSGITLGQKWDELLASKGGVLFYQSEPDVRNPSSDNAMGITCTDLKPKLAFFGIDLFTYSLWIVILLITILMWGLNEIRK